MTVAPVWREGSTFGVLDPSVGAGGVNPHSQIIYVNAVYDAGPQPSGIWHTVDAGKTVYNIDTGIPEDALAIWLSGILIISPGYAYEIADLQFYCRRLGAVPAIDGDTYLCAQTCSTAPAQGVRTNFTTLVPVTDRKFEFWWNRSSGGYWPDHTSYGIIAWPIGYIK